MFEDAVALDPEFALAYAGIANACAQHHYNYGRDPIWMERAMAAAEKAAALAADLPEVHVAQAWVALCRAGSTTRPCAHARRRSSSKRDCEGAYYLLGRALFAAGRYQEVADIADAALEASGEDYNIYVPS